MSRAPDPRELRRRFEAAGQEHVLAFLDELAPERRAAFQQELARVDLERVREQAALLAEPPAAARSPRFEPPEVFPRSRDAAQRARASEAVERGNAELAAGRVGFLLVAGGQGSRLGFDGPKGLFPAGPVSGRTLFELFARKLLALCARHGVAPLWFVMTSGSNDATTRAAFAAHEHFGLAPSDVHFFRQADQPALDAHGRIVLAEKDALFLAPDGHGGVLSALARSGGLALARERGIERFSYFQVDNPLAEPGDALFLGLHALAGARMSTKVVAKRDAAEKVGVLGKVEGALSCIEYSDLPAALRERRGADGELEFRAGNSAIHVIDRAFVEELARGDLELPWHLARKRLACIDEHGRRVEREGVKFERFVFDALRFSPTSVVLEVERAEEFSPIKNQSGEDSPASARAAQCARFAGWVRAAGLPLPAAGADGNVPVEVDPLYAGDERELLERVRAGVRSGTPRVLATGHLYELGLPHPGAAR